MKTKTINTEINETDFQQSAEEIAKSLEKISKGMATLFRSRLTDDTILWLIAKASGESQKTVHNVIYGMKALSKKFVKP